MEKEEQTQVEEQVHEQEQYEEEEEEEESTLLVRKSRNGDEAKLIEFDSVGVEVSNGISKNPNGNGILHTFVTENGTKIEDSTAETENGTKIEDSTEEKMEELDGVLENEAEVKIEEQKSEKLVFYDKDEGIGSTFTYSGEKKIKKDPKPDTLDISSLDSTLQNNSTSTDNGHEEHLETNSSSRPNIQPSESSSHEQVASKHSEEIESSFDEQVAEEIESAEIDVTNEDGLEVADLDVENVLQKQTTHDLYCPNCNSCITKRVILRKRKRRIRVSDEEVKRNKIEAAVNSNIGIGLDQTSSNQVEGVGFGDTQVPTTDEDERVREPDVFRCLSCFSIFIQQGTGFKLFRRFGDKRVEESAQGEQVPNTKKNWFTSMFASNKQEAAAKQGSSLQTDAPKSNVVVSSSSNLGNQSSKPSLTEKDNAVAPTSEGVAGTAGSNDTQGDKDGILHFPTQEPALNGKVVNGAGYRVDTTEKTDATKEQSEAHSEEELIDSNPTKEVHMNGTTDPSVTVPPKRDQVTNGESADVAFSSQGGLKWLVSPNEGSAVPVTSEKGVFTDKASGKASVSENKASGNYGKLGISVAFTNEGQEFRAEILPESVVPTFISRETGQIYPAEVSQHILTKTKSKLSNGDAVKVDSISPVTKIPDSKGEETIINIDGQPAESSQSLHDVTIPTESDSDPRITEARKELRIEVIKSMVYGGLAESITSLSVVSSAAGGSATTLNILAIGMANLIGGLFIICHNLWELRSDCREQVAGQMSNQIAEPRDRYRETLGRRRNFIIHAAVALTSYIIFGLVPPGVYGFSFRKSNDKQMKLLMVAAASLVCILVLAIGRAYVHRSPKPYLKTILTFLILACMGSGVSYACGSLIERLLEKLGLFQPTSVSNVVLPEMTWTDPAWASY